MVLFWVPSIYSLRCLCHILSTIRYVLNGCMIVATHKARFYKAKDSQLRLGPGPFVTALEYASGQKATVIGKPSAEFFKGAIDLLMIDDPGYFYMIGDVSF